MNLSVSGTSDIDNSVMDSSQAGNDKEFQSLKDRKTEQLPILNVCRFNNRMREILQCHICLELRRSPMYQCRNGHLICAGCFNDILVEGQLHNEMACCPRCKVTISEDLCFRNVAVEKTISELPITCPYCSLDFPPENFNYHESVICDKRTTFCSNIVIGCAWSGPNREKLAHEQQCKHTSESGHEILKSLAIIDKQQGKKAGLYNKIMDLLSFEKFSYTDFQLKRREAEGVNVKFQTSKFITFEYHWQICARVLTDPTEGFEFSFQLALKSKLGNSNLNVNYILLSGPYSEMEVKPEVFNFTFTDKNAESYYQTIYIPNTKDKNTFYVATRMNFRLLMFIR